MSTIFSYRQNPWPLRSMAVALLVEGGLILACGWVLHESREPAHRASGVVPGQTISLVMPTPAPTATPNTQPPAPKSAPQPVPKQPVPRPVQHVAHVSRASTPARPVAVPVPVSPPVAVAQVEGAATVPTVAAATATPPPAAAPAASTGPGPTDLFAAKLRAAIQAAVVYPFSLRDMGLDADIQVEFVYQDGAVSQVRVVRGGKAAAFDRAALAAVQAATMPQPPAELRGQAHTFRVTVRFVAG